jgi:phytanoyl-CoA hydroxylase
MIVQSMYIFKNPRIGGSVMAHTDNTYITTEPKLTCRGIWFSLDDAMLKNSCLFAIPGSHKRKTDFFFKRKYGDEIVEKEGEKPQKKCELIYEPENMPDYPDMDKAVSLEVKRGSIVLIHGDLVHFSNHNSSEHQRHAYSLHLVESRGAKWSKTNWLQRDNDLQFKLFNEVAQNY